MIRTTAAMEEVDMHPLRLAELADLLVFFDWATFVTAIITTTMATSTTEWATPMDLAITPLLITAAPTAEVPHRITIPATLTTTITLRSFAWLRESSR